MSQPTFRRDMLLAAMLSSLSAGLAESAEASPLNPEQTIIRVPGDLPWKPNPAYAPEHSVDTCVPVPAGSFVRRVAGTPHHDGVMRGHAEPAVIAICGMGPVNDALIDPSQPGVRRV